MSYTEINDFDIGIKMWRIDGQVNPRQLSIFCHAAWFENNGIVDTVPGMLCYYTEHGVSIQTDFAMTHAIAKDYNLIPIKELVYRDKTYNYSLNFNENNDEVEAYWQCVAASALSGEEPADILLVTGTKKDDAQRKSDRYYLMSDIFTALADKNFSYELIRFYGCREIQKNE